MGMDIYGMAPSTEPDGITLQIDSGVVGRITDDLRHRLTELTVDAVELSHVQFVLQVMVLGRLLAQDLTDGDKLSVRLVNTVLTKLHVPWQLTLRSDASKAFGERMNRQQRRAKASAIHEQCVHPRILEAIRDAPFDRQFCGLAGAIAVVLMDAQMPPDRRAWLLREMAECLIAEIDHMEGLNSEQLVDRLLALHSGWNDERAGTA
jgi:hypothetical protein